MPKRTSLKSIQDVIGNSDGTFVDIYNGKIRRKLASDYGYTLLIPNFILIKEKICLIGLDLSKCYL